MNSFGTEASRRHAGQWAAILGCLLLAAIVVAACSSGTLNTASGMSTVNVVLSDPATCQAPGGQFSHVYVTITDVKAHVSATASDTDSGWVDITPGLAAAPKQIDLLGQANNQCFLATLGSTQQLQAGKYQQIRMILASNSVSIANNLCTNGAPNCVVLSDKSAHTLNLSSEAQTGIKIPSGQIASGGFSIAAGETRDLDIDFNTCSSIVAQGNGQYRLKPVLHAGEVSTTATSINGKVLDSTTGNAMNGSVLVALEQKDTSGVDRVVMSTMAATDGGFVFCPLPVGTYDVVIVGTRTDGVMFEPAIVTGVAVGSTTGTVMLTSLPVTTSTSVATLNGIVTSQNSATPTPAGTVADVDLTALETVNTVTYTIPLPPTATQSSFDLVVETAASSTCPTGTDCVNYSMKLPSGGAFIGAWSASGPLLALSTTWATYTVDGIAEVPGSGGTADCNPSEIKLPLDALTSAGPFTVSVPVMRFVQCQ